jgi:hypothetical protein
MDIYIRSVEFLNKKKKAIIKELKSISDKKLRKPYKAK